MSVIRLPLAVDDQAAARLESLFWSMFCVKRALQRSTRSRLAEFWAGGRRRQDDAARWRRELGLSRRDLERIAYAHVDGAGWLKHHVSKALVMHQADEVWTGVERHLFPDASGRRAGRPRVGSWWEYRRIAGRARSHTRARKWETFRLHGSLQGHLDAYRHPALPAETATPAQVVSLAPGTPVLAQPRRLRPPRPVADRPGKCSWWDHDGPLTVVFAGGPDSERGELALPVRLPSGAGRWRWLRHFLGRPQLWHKIDLVRRPCLSAPGGWTYEAHLMILDGGYISPATRERRRCVAALERVGGVDVNVSNLSIVSLPVTLDPADGPVLADQIVLTEVEKAAIERDRRTVRRRARALERSRRASNKAQYELSRRQRKREQRRRAAGLPTRHVDLPKGSRLADRAGRPRNAYRKDRLTVGYRKLRTLIRAERAGRTEAQRARARQMASHLVAVHGVHLTVEACILSSWFRRWGRACAAFTPGMLTSALAVECAAAGGRLGRASTFTTALSQHCLCGQKVNKALADRIHRCPACGLTGDRDLVSAALGAFVTWTDQADPRTASVDFSTSRHALDVFGLGLQGALTESTVTRSRPARRTRGKNGSRTRKRTASARSHPERQWSRPRTGTRQGPHRTDVIGPRTVPTCASGAKEQALVSTSDSFRRVAGPIARSCAA
ncbi:zinc ribbon domain-containing protein [Actinocorallia populi]|uniref:zinc ribbon domain-containing protein n=1 Tax=Actinocorallia populi TaxID=2079200 RepID=UPI0013006577|nr:transposase [Actinocorallia populi]